MFRPEGIYFPILTGGLYIILLIIRLLAKTIKDIAPKIPDFNDVLRLLLRNIILKFQVSHSNLLLADFKLQWLSIMLSERTTCGMIWKMWFRSTKPVANGSGRTFFATAIIKKYQTFERCGGPFKSTELFCNILMSLIINNWIIVSSDCNSHIIFIFDCTHLH